MSLEMHSFELPPIGTQCYVLIDAGRQELAVFDAPLNAWPTVERLAAQTGCRISGLYFTHGHWDHTLDGHKFNTAGVPVFAHRDDAAFFATPEVMAAYSIPGLQMPVVEVNNWLEDGQSIEILGQAVDVRHVPGHSPGSVLFWFREEDLAITGDAIFRGSVGRTDFPGCSFEQLATSIREKIYTLPDETTLYPGHGPESTVGREAASNPFVNREAK